VATMLCASGHHVMCQWPPCYVPVATMLCWREYSASHPNTWLALRKCHAVFAARAFNAWLRRVQEKRNSRSSPKLCVSRSDSSPRRDVCVVCESVWRRSSRRSLGVCVVGENWFRKEFFIQLRNILKVHLAGGFATWQGNSPRNSVLTISP